jgi:hypothetical protein
VSDSAADTVRSTVVGWLRDLLPSSWDVKAGQAMPGQLARPTLYVNYSGLEPLPAAPLGHVLVTMTLTVADHHADTKLSEDAVDEQVIDLILALDAHPKLAWTSASKLRVEGNDALGWTMTVTTTATTSKEEKAS